MNTTYLRTYELTCTRPLSHLGFLADGTRIAKEYTATVSNAGTLESKEEKKKIANVIFLTGEDKLDKRIGTYRDSLLVSDLSSDVGTGVPVAWEAEVSKATKAAAISYSLSVLPNDVTWAEVGDDAYNTSRMGIKKKKREKEKG